MAERGGSWNIAPSSVRIHGGGWSQERVRVGGLTAANPEDAVVTFTDDRLELTVFRTPAAHGNLRVAREEDPRHLGRVDAVLGWPEEACVGGRRSARSGAATAFHEDQSLVGPITASVVGELADVSCELR